jgi:hypothetical protein
MQMTRIANKKNILILTGIVVIALIAGFFYYQKIQNEKKAALEKSKVPQSEMSVFEGEKKDIDRTIYKKEFSILAPQGWKEFGAPSEYNVMIRNEKETISDAKANQINFKTYYSVTSFRLAGRKYADYVKAFKTNIAKNKNITGVKFSSEKNDKINGLPAIILEYEGNSKGVLLKIMSIFIQGSSDDVWQISFNTVKGNWGQDKKTFDQIAKTFKLEK